MTLFTESADVSVRPAVAGDQVPITEIQLTAWRVTHHHTLPPDVLEHMETDRIREQWESAITETPGRGFGVFIACEGPRIVGFAAVAPGQIIALEVLPDFQRQGHGSRLLSAAVDKLRRDESTEIVTWILDKDAAREQFFSGAGLGSDNRVRTLAAGPREVNETRWSAEL